MDYYVQKHVWFKGGSLYVSKTQLKILEGEGGVENSGPGAAERAQGFFFSPRQNHALQFNLHMLTQPVLILFKEIQSMGERTLRKVFFAHKLDFF